MKKMPLNQLIKMLESSLQELVQKDMALIDRGVQEECINHRFAICLEKNLYAEYRNLSVDLEYNKNYSNPKVMDIGGERKNIIPDIIIHERNTNNKNFLFVEAKKNYMNKKDIAKLEESLEDPYNYHYSLSIEYRVKGNTMNLILREYNEFIIKKTHLFFSKEDKKLFSFDTISPIFCELD